MKNLKPLTHEQYVELQAQYEITPDAYSFSPTGEHYQLRYLLRQYGYRVDSCRGAELELASRLLSLGYAR